MKVMKFGGGCLKDERSFARVAGIIQAERKAPVVVVSAISGITDFLFESIAKAKKSEKNISASIQTLRNIHLSLAEKMVKDEKIEKETSQNIEEKLKKVKRLLYGVAYTGEIFPAIRSHVLSFGERLSALVLSAKLRSMGLDSQPMESDQIGLITDNNLENATVNLREFKKKFKPIARSLVRGKIVPVITGFFGCTPEGKISTFGRNGSDYSAAVIACGLKADALEIWKDVDGFMSADPKLVKSAAKIDRLSYEEAAELSYFGAKILHPRTFEPLLGLRTSVRIKNLLDPKSPGTEISPVRCVKKDIIKSITFNKQIAMLRIHGPGVGYKPGIIGQIGHRLSLSGINIYSIITSQTCINLLLDKKDASLSFEALKEMRGGVIGRVDLDEDIALIAAVGEGLLMRKGLAAKIFSSISKAKVNVKMISSGASEVASYFIINRNDTEKAIHALHHEFFK